MNPLTRTALLLACLGGIAESALAQILMSGFNFESPFTVTAVALYACAGVMVVMRIAASHPYARFGAANGVTLMRLILTCLFAGLVCVTAADAAVFTAPVAWTFFFLGALTLLLDGVDGFLARTSGLSSAFGARFDMETDALLILLLSILAFTTGKAGAWIITAGVLRYLYVCAGWLWPALARPLPDSWRRKFVCVVQAGALVVVLTPPLTPPWSTGLAALALVLLIYSFGKDVAWGMTSPQDVSMSGS